MTEFERIKMDATLAAQEAAKEAWKRQEAPGERITVALLAYNKVLNDAGYVVAPRQPTPRMRRACKMALRKRRAEWPERLKRVEFTPGMKCIYRYQAMIEAFEKEGA